MQEEKVRKTTPTMLPNVTRVGTNGDNVILEFGFEVSEGEFEIFSSVCLNKKIAMQIKEQIDSAFR